MAQGGLLIEKSPSPPKTDWTESSETLNDSITEQLQRFIARKSATGSSDTGESGANGSAGAVVSVPTSGANVKKLIMERDEMWREYAKQQVAFIQQEHGKMLKSLHHEIERLQQVCADLTQQIADKGSLATHHENGSSMRRYDELENKLNTAKANLAQLQSLTDQKDLKILSMQQRWNDLEMHYKNELSSKNKKIKDISSELTQKSTLVVQLTTQLHQLRLKEAIEKQRNEQQIRKMEQQPMRFLRANGSIASVPTGSSETPIVSVEVKQLALGERPPGEPRRPRPGFRITTIDANHSAPPHRSSVFPPISTSPTSFLSSAVNIEKPNSTSNKQATVTTKTAFRSSLKRVKSISDRKQEN